MIWYSGWLLKKIKKNNSKNDIKLHIEKWKLEQREDYIHQESNQKEKITVLHLLFYVAASQGPIELPSHGF